MSTAGGVLVAVSLTALVFSVEPRAEGPRGDQAPALSPECVARQGRRIDEGLTTIDVDAIEREVRLRYVEPVVSIEFARSGRSKSSDRRTVGVRLLRECSDKSASGPVVYVRRHGKGWRIDGRRIGSWDRSTSH